MKTLGPYRFKALRVHIIQIKTHYPRVFIREFHHSRHLHELRE